MDQNFEIEYKNLLTREEYLKILSAEFLDSDSRYIMGPIIQSNYYFDTINQDLKEQHSALRIRVTDSSNELTLKVPHQGFLMETNLLLSDNSVSEILDKNQFVLSSYFTSDEIFQNAKNLNNEMIFYLFNAFQTKRFEKIVDQHLLVLDQTTFQNGEVDYELEVESTDIHLGKRFFDDVLNKYGILKKNAYPKIQRAEENK